MCGTAPHIIRFNELSRWDVKSFCGHFDSKHQIVPLKELITEHNEKIRLFDYPQKKFKILGVNNIEGIFYAYDVLGKEVKQPYKKVNSGDFAYNPYRVNIGSIGWVPPEHSDAYISPAYVVFSIDTSVILSKVLWFILKSDLFNRSLRAATAGSVRMNLTYPLLATLKIPIPPLSVQHKIVEHWEKAQIAIAASRNRMIQIEQKMQEEFLDDLGLVVPKHTTPAKFFAVNWRNFERWSINYHQSSVSMINILRGKYPVSNLGSILELVQYGTSEKANSTKKGIPILRMNNIKDGHLNFSDLKYIDLPQKMKESLLLVDGDILFNRTNSKDLVGKCAVFYNNEEFVFASYLIRIRIDREQASADFIAHCINSIIVRQQINTFSRQIIGQANINSQELKSLRVPLPPLDIQIGIMKKLQEGRKVIILQDEAIKSSIYKTQRQVEQMLLGNMEER